MGFGLIANALAGGLAGAGAQGARVFERAGEQQWRSEFEAQRAQIEQDRQMALAKFASQTRREDAKYADELQAGRADTDRKRVAGIIQGAASSEMADGPPPPGRLRAATRAALASSGDLTSAANYDKVTQPDKPTVVQAGFGGKAAGYDADGNQLFELDNSSEIRAELEGRKADAAGRGRAPRQRTQEDEFKIEEQAGKAVDRLVKERPHPLADPLSQDKDSKVDQAFAGAARGVYVTMLGAALDDNRIVRPGAIEKVVTKVADTAHTQLVTEARKMSSEVFDAKGRLLTGGQERLTAFGVNAATPAEFVRAYRDQNLAKRMDLIIERSIAERSGGAGAPPAAGGPGATAAQARRMEPVEPAQPGMVEAAAAAPTPASAAAPPGNAPPPTMTGRGRDGKPYQGVNPDRLRADADVQSRFEELVSKRDPSAIALVRAKGAMSVTIDDMRAVVQAASGG
jgi:hypothetical protein